jgi:polygalacturonase
MKKRRRVWTAAGLLREVRAAPSPQDELVAALSASRSERAEIEAELQRMHAWGMVRAARWHGLTVLEPA